MLGAATWKKLLPDVQVYKGGGPVGTRPAWVDLPPTKGPLAGVEAAADKTKRLAPVPVVASRPRAPGGPALQDLIKSFRGVADRRKDNVPRRPVSPMRTRQTTPASVSALANTLRTLASAGVAGPHGGELDHRRPERRGAHGESG